MQTFPHKTDKVLPEQSILQGLQSAVTVAQKHSVKCLVQLSAATILAVTTSSWAQVAIPPSYPQESQNQGVVVEKKAAKPAKSTSKDLFAGDNWHAVSPSWPGVLTFDEKTKRISLRPMGANPFEANYEYSVTSPKSSKDIKGTMKFSDDLGRKSDMTFVLVNKKELTLKFNGQQKQELYKRMSAAEVQAYEDNIRAMLSGVKPLPGK